MLRLALAGILFGASASAASARLISSLLFATSPWDATTYTGMVLALVAVALVSSYLPARRASNIHPMAALRVRSRWFENDFWRRVSFSRVFESEDNRSRHIPTTNLGLTVRRSTIDDEDGLTMVDGASELFSIVNHRNRWQPN